MPLKAIHLKAFQIKTAGRDIYISEGDLVTAMSNFSGNINLVTGVTAHSLMTVQKTELILSFFPNASVVNLLSGQNVIVFFAQSTKKRILFLRSEFNMLLIGMVG